jgi:hypothetical protein
MAICCMTALGTGRRSPPWPGAGPVCGLPSGRRQELIYARTRQAMDLLSLLPRCRRASRTVQHQVTCRSRLQPDWTGIYAARKDGSSLPAPQPTPGAEPGRALLFPAPLRSWGLVFGEYAVDRVLGIPSVAYARPVYGPSVRRRRSSSSVSISNITARSRRLNLGSVFLECPRRQGGEAVPLTGIGKARHGEGQKVPRDPCRVLGTRRKVL